MTLLVPLTCSLTANAQEIPRQQVPSNVVVISANGQLDVPQDWLTLMLTVAREGTEPVAVQAQLRQALDAALTVAKSSAMPQQMEVRTGTFGIYPRQGANGKITAWQGTAELVLEGRDFSRISGTAGRVSSMNVASVAFSLSHEAQQKLESEAQGMAIDRFKAKATEVARSFGFSGYTLREVSVSAIDQGERPVFARARQTTMATSMASDAPLPVEAGKSQVTVTVSGSIQLR